MGDINVPAIVNWNPAPVVRTVKRTLSDGSINRGLVCVARIPSSTDLKDPDAHVLDGWVPATTTCVPSMHMTPEDGMRLPKW